MKGIKPPPLGSPQDIVLRKYDLIEGEKQVTFNKIITQAVLVLGKGNQEFTSSTTKLWNQYVNLVYNTKHEAINEEMEMRADYDKYRRLKATMSRDSDGGLVVRGLLS